MKLQLATLLLLVSAQSLSFADSPRSAELNPQETWRLLQDGLGENWAGVWNQTVSILICGTDSVLFSSASVDTICASETISPDIDEADNFECSGTYSEAQVDLDCTGNVEDPPGCHGTYTWDYTATLTGDSFTAEVTLNGTFSGTCPQPDPFCSHIRIMGTRAGPAPEEACNFTAVESGHWGAIKWRYR
jgi:hypothetical protein